MAGKPPRLHNELYPFIHPDKFKDSLKSQVVVITGAGGTIGQAIAKSFAVAGAVLYLVDYRVEPLPEVEAAALRLGAQKVYTAALDVSNFEECKAIIEKVRAGRHLHRYKSYEFALIEWVCRLKKKRGPSMS